MPFIVRNAAEARSAGSWNHLRLFTVYCYQTAVIVDEYSLKYSVIFSGGRNRLFRRRAFLWFSWNLMAKQKQCIYTMNDTAKKQTNNFDSCWACLYEGLERTLRWRYYFTPWDMKYRYTNVLRLRRIAKSQQLLDIGIKSYERIATASWVLEWLLTFDKSLWWLLPKQRDVS